MRHRRSVTDNPGSRQCQDLSRYQQIPRLPNFRASGPTWTTWLVCVGRFRFVLHQMGKLLNCDQPMIGPASCSRLVLSLNTVTGANPLVTSLTIDVCHQIFVNNEHDVKSKSKSLFGTDYRELIAELALGPPSGLFVTSSSLKLVVHVNK